MTHAQRDIDFLLRHARASEMHAGLHPNEFLACFDEFRGELRCASSGVPGADRLRPSLILKFGMNSPGDVYELGAQCAHALDTVEKVLEALRGECVNKVAKRASGGRARGGS